MRGRIREAVNGLNAQTPRRARPGAPVRADRADGKRPNLLDLVNPVTESRSGMAEPAWRYVFVDQSLEYV